MSDYAYDDPTGPASIGGADTVGDVGNDDPVPDDTDWVRPEPDPDTDPATEWS